MKNLFIISILMVSMQTAVAQKIDTIYYDANWKGVPVKTLASFMRIAYLPGNSQLGTAKDFHITGELQTEGLIPVYIDKNDDLKSKFKGHTVNYYKSGKKRTEYYKNDSCQIEGERTDYYENGLKKAKGTYKNDKLEGESTYYYENGNIKLVEVCQKDVCQESTNYNENGVKLNMLKGTFKNGKFDDGVQTEYYENGFKKVEEIIKNGQQDGEQTNYFENGLRKSKGVVKNGKWIGTFYQFNVDGSYCEFEYIDGQHKDNYILVSINGKRTKIKFNTKQ